MTSVNPKFDPAHVPASAFLETLNVWPTFAAQAIAITEFQEDWSSVTVRLDLTPQNANYFGTAFGGSLFSMLDPFLVILLARQLGTNYAVWDKRVEIDFKRPGTGPVVATVEMPTDIVEEIREATESGAPVLQWFEVPILLESDGTVIAVQRREIYVRKLKPQAENA